MLRKMENVEFNDKMELKKTFTNRKCQKINLNGKFQRKRNHLKRIGVTETEEN